MAGIFSLSWVSDLSDILILIDVSLSIHFKVVAAFLCVASLISGRHGEGWLYMLPGDTLSNSVVLLDPQFPYLFHNLRVL